MIKLKKFFKPYIFLILFTLVCLFGQALTELNLPDYMSKIVNNGIQGEGFDGPVTDYITKETYNHLLLFASSNDKKVIQDAYKPLKSVTSSQKEKYPNLKIGDYQLVKNDSSLENHMVKPLVMTYFINTMNTKQKNGSEFINNIKKSINKMEKTYNQASSQYTNGYKQYEALNKINPVQASIIKKQLDQSKVKLDQLKNKISEMKKNLKNHQYFYFIELMPKDKRDEMYQKVSKQMNSLGNSTLMLTSGKAAKYEYQLLGANTTTIQMHYIYKIGLFMLLIAALGAVLSITSSYLAALTSSKIARDLRSAVFKKVESFSSKEIGDFSTASLITRSTNDITQIQQVIQMMMRLVLYAPLLGAGGLLKAIDNSPSMTWVIFIVLLFIICVLAITMIIAMPKFKMMQKLVDKLNLAMRENLSGLLVIRAFGNEKVSEERFDKANQNLTKVNLFVNRVMTSLMPIMMFTMQVMSLLVVYIGAKQTNSGNIAIGQMMAFIQYAMIIIMSFLLVAMVSVMLPRASVSANRVHEVLTTNISIMDGEKDVKIKQNEEGHIKFDHVSFAYPGASEQVLEDITFETKPGEITAIIGSTGSGKSTLLQLMLRFYDATSGKIMIHGNNVKDYHLDTLRQSIAYVPQKAKLFKGTIESNITYGSINNKENIEKALDVSMSKEFVEKKELGIKEEIAQGGANVSGGQKQRLSIARAIMKDAPILLFDDSFSALDYKTDAIVREKLNQLMKTRNTSVIIVGQRIASIRHANQIIVLDEGKIVGKGTHDELMLNNHVYKEIALSQLSKEELA